MTSSHPGIGTASHHNGATVTHYRFARVNAETSTEFTLIAISGEIDAANVDEVSRDTHGLVPEGGALIVDLTATYFLAIDGLRALFALHNQCARTGTKWALIAEAEANRLLRVGDPDKLLPAVGSAAEALRLVRRNAPARARGDLPGVRV